MLRLDDRLIVARGSSVTIAAINGAEYRILKALAHLPVLVQLESWLDGPAAVMEFADDIAVYERFLRDRAIDASVFNTLVEKLARRALTDNERVQLTAIQKRLIALAAEDEIAELIAALLQTKHKLAAAGCWEQAHFVVCGGNQPRYKHLSKNFFKRLLTEQTRSHDAAIHRVMYSETCDNLDAARELVADRLLNGRLAEVFMGSPLSLDADVLGEAGLAAIDRCFADGRAGCLL